MLLLILIPILAIVAYLISIFNKLTKLRERCKNAWSQIDVILQERNDLIPNLVNVVKGYAKHEQETLERIIQARNSMLKAQGEGNVENVALAENQIQGALKTIFALQESYPDLKANQNFLDLQEKLTGMENKIAATRQFYSDSVTRYNTAIKMFPSNIIASMFNFKEMKLFEVTSEEVRNVPKVEF